MPDIPPSYQAAISQDHWLIVAPYLHSTELCVAARVCSRWHEIFVPFLWGNPTSHFATEKDAVYVALVHFKRTLPLARPFVRQMTHTLHLPPAHAELYEGPHPDWLRDILEQLPNLQSLIVKGLPFLDHGSLLTLKYSSPQSRIRGLSSSPIYHLRYLDASSCRNATSAGLGEALRHLPLLLYLNLAKTPAAKDKAVISVITNLTSLQVLKLRDIGLKDDHVAQLARGLRLRIRSLDVSDNELTDSSVRDILEFCVEHALPNTDSMVTDRPLLEHWPTNLPLHSGDDVVDWYEGENLDIRLHAMLTSRLNSHLALEDAPHSGLTHIYMYGNLFTIEPVSALLQSLRIQVLDIGALSTKAPKSLSGSCQTGTKMLKLPGAEKLTPVFAKGGFDALKFLRIHHGLVTKTANYPQTHIKHSALQELDAEPRLGPELDSALAYSELSAEAQREPSFTDTGLQINISHTKGANERSLEEPTPILTERRGPAFAPEPVISPISPAEILPERFGTLSVLQSNNTAPSARPVSPASSLHIETPLNASQQYSYILRERRNRTKLHQSRLTFHPSMLPRLKTLVLTSIPATTRDDNIAASLTAFIQACAEESYLANLESRASYIHPPGRQSQAAALKAYAKSVFALEKIILEVTSAPSSTSEDESNSQPQRSYKHNSRPTSPWRIYSSGSTDDPDTEAFWRAAQSDFTFFGDSECGQPSPETSFTDFVTQDKVVLTPGTQPGDFATSAQVFQPRYAISAPTTNLAAQVVATPAASKPLYDVISRIAAYRRERKAAYKAALLQHAPTTGDMPVEVAGYWDGEIQVVRKTKAELEEEQRLGSDYYGNVYKEGYNYR